jgi:hypothetical protein
VHLLKRRTPRPGHEGFATDAVRGVRGLGEQQLAPTHAGSMAAAAPDDHGIRADVLLAVGIGLGQVLSVVASERVGAVRPAV